MTFTKKHLLIFILISLLPIIYLSRNTYSFCLTTFLCLFTYVFSLYFECKTKEEKALVFLSALFSIIFIFQNNNLAFLFAYLIAIFAFYFHKKHNWILKYTVLSYLFLYIYYSFCEYQTLFGGILILVFSAAFIRFFSCFKKEYIAIIFELLLAFLLVFATQILNSYRYSYVSISDILSLKTALGLASNYNVSISFLLIQIMISILVIVIYKIFVQPVQRNKNQLLKSFFLSCISFIFLGFQATFLISSGKITLELSALEGFSASVIESAKLTFSSYNLKEEKSRVEVFTDDMSNNQAPNIINILCETYADVAIPLSVTPSRDPMRDFKALSEFGCKSGSVIVDTIGGGTSKSEWEYLTGLDVKNLSNHESPFLNKCKTNYAFTANDNLYGTYEKTFIHPFFKTGWNRESVYSTFGYDNQYFINNADEAAKTELIRNFPTDKWTYDRILDLIEKNDEPQFINCVTIQNHGGYEQFELENTISVKEDIPNKKAIENYLTLIEYSSKDIYNLIKRIDETVSEPTLVVFYGDHFPGGFIDHYDPDYYKTPYMIYSNFSDLNDIPEQMDLSLLYPNAKSAAGLPLSAYEKYLLSLQGETAEKSFIISRIKHGYY